MKRTAVITALTAFALAPIFAWANCSGDHDDSSASATAPTTVASLPAPAASKVPAASLKQTSATSSKKPVAKAKAPTAEGKKIVATASN